MIVKENLRDPYFRLSDEEGNRLEMKYDCEGEPFRNGVRLDFTNTSEDSPSHTIYLTGEDLSEIIRAFFLIHPSVTQQACVGAVFEVVKNDIEKNGAMDEKRLNRLEYQKIYWRNVL
jgi:hypothetical protein